MAVRLFAGEGELYSWLTRNRQLDMAILRLDSFQGKNGRVLHLAVYAEVGKPRTDSADLVVLQHRMETGCWFGSRRPCWAWPTTPGDGN